MYDNLVGLAFTNAYTGIVTAAIGVPDKVYRTLQASDEFEAWYFDHRDRNGVIWIATGGRHGEPIIEWLHDARHRLNDCATMLAAVVRNGASIPPNDAIMFFVPRRKLDREGVQRLAEFGYFTIYQPYADEFRLIVPKHGESSSTHASLGPIATDVVELKRRTMSPGNAKEKPSKPGGYDPIAAQVHEVMFQMTGQANAAVERLSETWGGVWPPVPDDIQRLQSDISLEQERLNTELSVVPVISADRDRVMADVDRYAQILTKARRVASDLSRKLIQVNPAPPKGATHEQVAAPMMLRAIERYTSDLAIRLNVYGYTFVPVIGEQFAVRTKLFPDLWQSDERSYDLSAAVVEIPAETRLRLGAIPMLAREVAWMMQDDLNRIVIRLKKLRHDGDHWARSFLPPPPDKPDDRDRQDRIAREMAADLIATAAAGPQYVLAMARFAVGTLSRSELSDVGGGQRLPFHARLSACLELLHARTTPIDFASVYLPASKHELPEDIRKLLEVIAPTDRDLENLDDINDLLCEGCVVEARPLAILGALWRAVAKRSRYVNEVAALVSVAAAT